MATAIQTICLEPVCTSRICRILPPKQIVAFVGEAILGIRTLTPKILTEALTGNGSMSFEIPKFHGLGIAIPVYYSNVPASKDIVVNLTIED